MSFSTNAAASAQLNILSTGNVGINTTAPTSALHVVGTGNITGNVTVGGTLAAVSVISSLPDVFYGTILTVEPYNYAAWAFLRYESGYNPKNLYDEALYKFTAPYACVVEVQASACLSTTATTGFNMWVFKHKIANKGFLCSISNGFGYQTGAGVCVVECLAGEYLTIKTSTGGPVASASCLYKILEIKTEVNNIYRHGKLLRRDLGKFRIEWRLHWDARNPRDTRIKTRYRSCWQGWSKRGKKKKRYWINWLTKTARSKRRYRSCGGQTEPQEQMERQEQQEIQDFLD